MYQKGIKNISDSNRFNTQHSTLEIKTTDTVFQNKLRNKKKTKNFLLNVANSWFLFPGKLRNLYQNLNVLFCKGNMEKRAGAHLLCSPAPGSLTV